MNKVFSLHEIPLNINNQTKKTCTSVYLCINMHVWQIEMYPVHIKFKVCEFGKLNTEGNSLSA